jgi:hypothetical protein
MSNENHGPTDFERYIHYKQLDGLFFVLEEIWTKSAVMWKGKSKVLFV